MQTPTNLKVVGRGGGGVCDMEKLVVFLDKTGGEGLSFYLRVVRAPGLIR